MQKRKPAPKPEQKQQPKSFDEMTEFQLLQNLRKFQKRFAEAVAISEQAKAVCEKIDSILKEKFEK